MDNPAQLTLGFGKHRDAALEDIPEDYVEWLLREVDRERFGTDLGGIYVEELERQLRLKRGEGAPVNRTLHKPDPSYKPDPLPHIADCVCGISMPVATRDPFECVLCGATVYPT